MILCSYCSSDKSVSFHYSFTNYVYHRPLNIKQDDITIHLYDIIHDSNHGRFLCADCIEYDIEHWNSMWEQSY